MMRKIAIVGLLIASPAPALAAMSVSEFLAKASALEKKGVTALFSSDFSRLRDEVKSAGLALRDEQKTARAAGRRPIACLPEGKVPVKSDELLSYFRAIPPAQQTMTVATAFTGMMRKKYPCSA